MTFSSARQKPAAISGHGKDDRDEGRDGQALEDQRVEEDRQERERGREGPDADGGWDSGEPEPVETPALGDGGRGVLFDARSDHRRTVRLGHLSLQGGWHRADARVVPVERRMDPWVRGPAGDRTNGSGRRPARRAQSAAGAARRPVRIAAAIATATPDPDQDVADAEDVGQRQPRGHREEVGQRAEGGLRPRRRCSCCPPDRHPERGEGGRARPASIRRWRRSRRGSRRRAEGDQRHARQAEVGQDDDPDERRSRRRRSPGGRPRPGRRRATRRGRPGSPGRGWPASRAGSGPSPGRSRRPPRRKPATSPTTTP